MADAAASIAGVETVQNALLVLQTLSLTSWQYPSQCTFNDGDYFDFIVVGGGSAGCVLAHRLSANLDVKVLLIEAGGYLPLEAQTPGLFTTLPHSVYDYNFTSIDDGYTAQNMQGKVIGLTQGKMMGGSSGLNHLMYSRGDPSDYNQWAELLNDPRWNYTNVLPYFKKFEQVLDEEIMSSPYGELHGSEGIKKLTREINLVNYEYFNAFEQLGHEIVLDTASDTSSLGYTQNLFTIADGNRQSNAQYLSPAGAYPNLCVSLFTTATKILTEKGTAVGVQVTINDEVKTVYAKKEIVVSAGAINSPKLLILSGIGPQADLEKLGIEVVADLPVGENFQDHPAAIIMYRMEESNDVPKVNLGMFSIPTTIGYASVNQESGQLYPDYQSINMLFPESSAAGLQLNSMVFKYSHEVSQKIFEANKGHLMLYTIIDLLKPKSRGRVWMESADPNADPKIYMGTFSDPSDLKLMSNSLKDFNRVLDTNYFKSVDASLIDVGICSDKSGDEFWECYALGITSTLWHYIGTCSMGTVLESDFRVKGVPGLRVIDSSAMPLHVSGNPEAAITMMAERGSDLILEDWNWGSESKKTTCQ